jgi:hypothetical protein
MALGSAKLVELKGMRRDLDGVESGELEEVELPLKEAKTEPWHTTGYVSSIEMTGKFGHLPDLVSYLYVGE